MIMLILCISISAVDTTEILNILFLHKSIPKRYFGNIMYIHVYTNVLPIVCFRTFCIYDVVLWLLVLSVSIAVLVVIRSNGEVWLWFCKFYLFMFCLVYTIPSLCGVGCFWHILFLFCSLLTSHCPAGRVLCQNQRLVGCLRFVLKNSWIVTYKLWQITRHLLCFIVKNEKNKYAIRMIVHLRTVLCVIFRCDTPHNKVVVNYFESFVVHVNRVKRPIISG